MLWVVGWPHPSVKHAMGWPVQRLGELISKLIEYLLLIPEIDLHVRHPVRHLVYPLQDWQLAGKNSQLLHYYFGESMIASLGICMPPVGSV